MQDIQTYYEVLEVPETATPAEIKTAYRLLVQQYHPDKVPDHLTKLRHDAEEKFKQIDEAYKVLGDAQQRAQYDAILGQIRADANDEPPAAYAAHQPPAGRTSEPVRPTRACRTNPIRTLPAWLLFGLAAAFGYWGYLLLTKTPLFAKNGIRPVQPPPYQTAGVRDTRTLLLGTWRDENSVSTYCADGTKTTTFDDGRTENTKWSVDGNIIIQGNGRTKLLELNDSTFVSEDSGGRWHATRVDPTVETNRKQRILNEAPKLLRGTWRETNHKWIRYFQDGTCETILDGEHKAGLNWRVNGDTVTFEQPSGRKSAYTLTDISEDRYTMRVAEHQENLRTLFEAFNVSGLERNPTAVKLDSASTEQERDQLFTTGIAQAALTLPGAWKSERETWRVFPDGALHIWYDADDFNFGKMESYKWQLNGDVLVLTDDSRRDSNGRIVTHIDKYRLLGVWNKYIGLGRMASDGSTTYAGYRELSRINSSQELATQHAEEMKAIDSAPSLLLGTWRDRRSTLAFHANGQCVLACDDKPRQTLTWNVAGTLLTVGSEQFRLWRLSNSILMLTDEDNRLVERQRVGSSEDNSNASGPRTGTSSSPADLLSATNSLPHREGTVPVPSQGLLAVKKNHQDITVPSERIELNLQEAQEALTAHDWSTASAKVELVLAVSPTDSRAKGLASKIMQLKDESEKLQQEKMERDKKLDVEKQHQDAAMRLFKVECQSVSDASSFAEFELTIEGSLATVRQSVEKAITKSSLRLGKASFHDSSENVTLLITESNIVGLGGLLALVGAGGKRSLILAMGPHSEGKVIIFFKFTDYRFGNKVQSHNGVYSDSSFVRSTTTQLNTLANEFKELVKAELQSPSETGLKRR